jgi:2,6-dihydroxypyridine 3-monooxygenase
MLHRALLKRVSPGDYHLSSEVLSFEQRNGVVHAEIATGTRVDGDLLVCADGIHSAARRRLLPDLQPAYAGYVGWRGTVVETELDEDTYATFADAITYCVVPNSHILVYPIPSLDGSLAPGRRLINWVWYRNVEPGADLERLLTDRQGIGHAVSVGAGEVADENIAELVGAAQRTLPWQLAELVGKSAEPFVQVVLDIGVSSMAFGRTVLIGDAAFALRPHVAAGTAKAADDAWNLAGMLAKFPDDIDHALGEWERGQLALGRAVTARSRDAGVRSQFDNTWELGEPLPFGLYESGDSLLREPGKITTRSHT